MKEIHAYRNEDGTYMVEYDAYVMDNGELREVTCKVPRAKITVEHLVEIGTGEICSITVKEN